MNDKRAFGVSCICILVIMGLAVAHAQQVPVRRATPPEKMRDGIFEVTLKSPEAQKMTVEELVRDRDLNPRHLFRVKTGGYISFDEQEWVDKIEFKVFDKPVMDLPEYKRFSELLVEINDKVFNIKRTLASYDLVALRLMNLCERSKFSSLRDIDDNIVQQLSVYRKLLLLRSLVVNALNRFIKDRSCRDQFADYQRTLNLYTKQLTELTRNYSRLARKALALAKDVSPPSEKAEESPAKK